MLGEAQAKWFVDAMAASRATWKLVACDQPLALVIGDGPGDRRFEGFGNVPFARDEFTADSIVLHVNFDLGQVRGYGLGKDVERLLMLLGLHRLRKLTDGDLRLRTACDLEPLTRDPVATRPNGFALPGLAELEADLHDILFVKR